MLQQIGRARVRDAAENKRRACGKALVHDAKAQL